MHSGLKLNKTEIIQFIFLFIYRANHDGTDMKEHYYNIYRRRVEETRESLHAPSRGGSPA